MTILAEYTLYRVIIVQLRELATWEGYGVRIIGDNDNIYPVLQLTNSSNTTAQICIFQWSIGQTVVLSGDVNINYCNFLYNKQYKGHGTAVYYSSNNALINSSLKLMFTGCDFFHNGILRTQSTYSVF